VDELLLSTLRTFELKPSLPYSSARFTWPEMDRRTRSAPAETGAAGIGATAPGEATFAAVYGGTTDRPGRLRASHNCGTKCHVPSLEEGVEPAETPGDGFRAGWLVAA